MSRSRYRGFSLIEILVVIAIIGVLSTLAIVSLGGARAKGRDAKRVSDAKQIQSALNLYFNDRNGFPVYTSAITLGSSNYKVLCDTAAGFQADTTGCNTTYLPLVPANIGPGGSDYSYTSSADGSTFSITFSLEGQTGSLAAGQHTATEGGIQ